MTLRTVLLASRAPWPPLGGDRLRTFHLVRALSSLGPVTVVTPGDDLLAGLQEAVPGCTVRAVPLPRRDRLGVLRHLASSTPLQQALYDTRALREATADAVRGADVVVAHLLRTMPWVPEASPPLLLCLQDALSAQAAEAAAAPGLAGGWRRLALRLEQPRLLPAELAAAARADRVSFISARDRDALVEAGLAAERTLVVPAAVEGIAEEPAREPEPGRLLFFGNLRTASNQDMAVHAARRLLPMVRSSHREARLAIAGIEAPAAVRRLDRLPGVDVLGRVDELASLVRAAWLTVCPLRFGSGVQNKVLESLAQGTPVVATPRVADTLAAGAPLAVGRLDRSFAVRAVELLAAPAERQRLGEAGIRFVREHHAPAVAMAPLLDAVRSLVR